MFYVNKNYLLNVYIFYRLRKSGLNINSWDDRFSLKIEVSRLSTANISKENYLAYFALKIKKKTFGLCHIFTFYHIMEYSFLYNENI